ncbi:MAG TPA: LysR family transcriptional regulator [Steroidobacteraceae bacterium]|nr:LysR family transcriptional regulator [Steroidobacteraceae bacterium]
MPRLNLRQLLIFTAVADAGSTVAAADRVSLSQSATSAALKELEQLLGSPLFDRVGRRLRLNETGRALLPQARALLDGATAIEREFDAEAAGVGSGGPARLRVGASTTIGNYLLPTLIARYRLSSPATQLDVRIGNTSEVSALVGRFEVDVGLIEGPCRESGVLAEAWMQDPLVILCAAHHPLLRGRKKRVASIDDLRRETWLLREPGSGTREIVEQTLIPMLHPLREGTQFGSTEAIKRAAAEGLGLTCLSFYAAEDQIALGRLVPLRTRLPRLTRQLYLIHHEAKVLTPNLTRFIQHCRSAGKAQRAPSQR